MASSRWLHHRVNALRPRERDILGPVGLVARAIADQSMSSEMSSCDCPYLIAPRLGRPRL
jgi:hypothetical protein